MAGATGASWRDFRISRVLSSNATTKTICLFGHFGQPRDKTSQAVVILARTPFDASQLAWLSELGGDDLRSILHNDIYHYYHASIADRVKLDVIHPCTEKHIAKYSAHRVVVVRESGEDFRRITSPCIDRAREGTGLNWVYAILDGTKEADKVLAKDDHPADGFVMIPDAKWDGADVATLWCLAICRRRDVRCLRDLRTSHLAMLESIRDGGIAGIQAKFGLRRDQIFVFVHYLPTYFHFHVHFVNAAWQDLPSFSVAGAHLLDDIIDALKAPGGEEYWAERAITFRLGENQPLYETWRQHGRVN